MCASGMAVIAARSAHSSCRTYNLPCVNRLDMLGMASIWEGKRPRVTDWFNRIKARAAFKPAFLDWCPPDLTADLLTFGRQSWPSVERMLAQAG